MRIEQPLEFVLAWRATLAVALATLALVALAAVRPAGGGTPVAPAAAARAHAGETRLPLLAQEPLAAALGRADSAYRLQASAPGVVEGRNAAQRLRLRFTRAGLQVRARAATLALSDPRIGYGETLRPLARVAPVRDGNRVSYAHGAVNEWYANGPLGLEQGFTIARAPAARAHGPLRIALAIGGDVRARLADGGRSVTFATAHGGALRYGALHVTDARGSTLPSSVSLAGGRLRLSVADRGAAYPLRVDPLIQEGGKLNIHEEVGAGHAGMSVALSADGKTALAGAPGDNDLAGAAWVFVRTPSGWVQQGPKLTGEAGEAGGACGPSAEEEEAEEECSFGRSVALSADGNTAIVGAPQAAGPCGTAGECPHQGAAWLYTRSGETWSVQARLAGGSEETTDGRFGRSVALSADGNTALVGASADQNGSGSAWVFTRSGASWTQQGAKLADTQPAPGAHFGVSVALSGDGDTALVGGPGAAGGAGAAWVFERSGSSWGALAAKLTGTEEQGPESRFGSSVALSQDGSTALVGARNDAEGAGAAWVFARMGQTWAQQGAKLTAADAEPPTGFGYSAALSADGSTALIGAPRDDVGTGAAWLFVRSGNTWSQQGSKLVGVERPDEAPRAGRFGASVALRADGAAALMGAPADLGHAGAVWAFASAQLTPEVTGVAPGAGPTAGGTTITITGNRLAEATAVDFLAASCSKRSEEGCTTPATSFTVNPSGSITAVTPPRPEGATYVIVTTPEGSSTLGAASEFTFVAPPVVNEVTPGEGPSGGGTTVTISGNHLARASSVAFGGVPAASFAVASDRSITAVTPAEPAGTVSVTVTTPGGASRQTVHSIFTFLDPAVPDPPAGTGAGPPPGPSGGVLAFGASCRATLAARTITVPGGTRARVKLRALGRGACKGKLRLNVRTRVGRRLGTKTIGVATFALAAARSATVSVKLNRTGRALLRRRHGRLSASLLVASLPPVARAASTTNVRLRVTPLPRRHARKH